MTGLNYMGNIPKGYYLNINCCENLKSVVTFII
jgi:hypothetical protein